MSELHCPPAAVRSSLTSEPDHSHAEHGRGRSAGPGCAEGLCERRGAAQQLLMTSARHETPAASLPSARRGAGQHARCPALPAELQPPRFAHGCGVASTCHKSAQCFHSPLWLVFQFSKCILILQKCFIWQPINSPVI